MLYLRLLLKFAEALYSDFNEVLIVLFPSPWKMEPTTLGDRGHADDAGARRCNPALRSRTQFPGTAGKEAWEEKTDGYSGRCQQPYPMGPKGSFPILLQTAFPSLPTSDPDRSRTKMPVQGHEQWQYLGAVPPQGHRTGMENIPFFPSGWKENSLLL